MYSIKSNKYSQFSEITVDFISDIPNLPTDCYVGSEAFCIENKKTYILNNQKQWIQSASRLHPGGGGESSPSAPTYLSELIDDSGHRTVTDTEKTTWNSKYSKPNTGITKTDLDPNVQASLEKADSAIQEHQDISNKANITDLPTKVSDLVNDSGYQTSSDVSTAITNNKFLVTFTNDYPDENSDFQWMCNKTFAEIKSAILANKTVEAKVFDNIGGGGDPFDGSGIYTLYSQDSTTIVFSILSDKDQYFISIDSQNMIYLSGNEFLLSTDLIKMDPINTFYPKIYKIPSEYAMVQYVSTAIAADKFIIEFTKENNVWSCDKTFEEIETAITTNKDVVAIWKNRSIDNNTFYYSVLNDYNSNSKTIHFISWIANLKVTIAVSFNSNSIAIGENNQSLEVMGNKITTISTSNPSTYKYPSESAVINYVSNIVGDIESVLNNILGIPVVSNIEEREDENT